MIWLPISPIASASWALAALKAVSPQAPVTDWFIGDDFHHNGAFFLLDAFSFFSGFGRPRPVPSRTSTWGFPWPNEDNYQFFLDLGRLRNANEKYFEWENYRIQSQRSAWWQPYENVFL